ncbi:MAG: sugar phosphate isomerase/epimerase [Planctomycetota bacterium]|nr:sugar phosphate isomerase/epimerase [Planctomycetota bacterium]MDA1025329.1 sugar phosphate isomerase/epimerase [Planctomycetota bacterium]
MPQPADPRRRSFFGGLAGLAAASTLSRASFAVPTAEKFMPPNPISLAQWSLHREIFGGKLDPLRFAEVTMSRYGLAGCEYVNSFYKDKVGTPGYLASMKKVADDHGVTSVLIMCDGEGALGDADEKKREKAVDNHQRWLEAAKFLGCHSIRVNAQSAGTWKEQLDQAADGLRMLSEKAAPYGLNVIVENHGGLSSNGEWLAGVMTKVAMVNCGTLPDFGNFSLGGGKWYDRYKGVTQLMPFAKAVSAKSGKFDEAGTESETDFVRMMKIVRAAGYRGWVGIEWEGGSPSEHEGIMLTKRMLERCDCVAARTGDGPFEAKKPAGKAENG